MIFRTALVVTLCTACGSVANPPPSDATSEAAPGARSYQGHVAETVPVTFGGPPPACVYTQTLKQLDVEVSILPSGQIDGGRVSVLNVEGLVMTCMYLPADPSITNFTFASAIPSPGGMTVTFQQRAGDKPGTSLLAELAPSDGAYTARLTFHRNDLGPPLDWTVVVTTSLLGQ